MTTITKKRGRPVGSNSLTDIPLKVLVDNLPDDAVITVGVQWMKALEANGVSLSLKQVATPIVSEETLDESIKVPNLTVVDPTLADF